LILLFLYTGAETTEDVPAAQVAAQVEAGPPAAAAPSSDSLIGDLLMDMSPAIPQQQPVAPGPPAAAPGIAPILAFAVTYGTFH